ncbi:MAG TPA: VOC family protein [Tepidisphaeraceae bacterium]|jgi:predicted enzyme related to lactoylglutathione lyase
MPITGLHAMFYSDRAAELRAFFRDKLRLPFTDVHDGWLIFDAPSGDLGVHPTEPGGHSEAHNTHNISFFCDDIQQTVADLQSRGVEFTAPVTDQGYGRVTYFKAPGDLVIQLYQPRYKKNPRQ